jgi:hypothetical protein
VQKHKAIRDEERQQVMNLTLSTEDLVVDV